jgi:hypothetical protein
MSQALLRAIAQADAIEISGFPWQSQGTSRTIGIRSLEARILCQRHNSVLSPLDTSVLELFQTIDDIHMHFQERQLTYQHRLNGHQCERWLLKAMCGYAVSGNFTDQQGNRITGWSPPVEWLKILFHDAPFPEHCGLYVSVKNMGTVLQVEPEIVRVAAICSGMDVVGMTLCVFDVVFLLVMDERLRLTQDGLLDDCYYRPTGIKYHDLHRTKEITVGLQWVGPSSGVTIVTKIFPREAAQP